MRGAIALSLILATSSASADSPAGEQRLTSDGLLKRDPVVWPGGKELIYAVEAPGTGRMRLMRLELDSGASKRFHDDKGISDRELTVSSDGGVYAYNVVSGLSSKLIVVDSARSTRVTIPQAGIANWANWPSVSPDGRVVVYTEGASAIFAYDVVANKGKEGLLRLTPKDADSSDLWPRFSPDGKRIVFASRRDDDFEVYVMDADGSNQTRLTKSPGIDARPVFSPDGKRIAFTSNRDGNYEIWVMNADGSEPRRITKNAERDDHACWSEDGKSLIWVSERGGRFDLYRTSISDRAAVVPPRGTARRDA